MQIILYPLSIPFKPIFSPISPTLTPGHGNRVSVSLILTTKECKEWFFPSGVINCAYTNACVAAYPTIKNNVIK